jgi:hypothetical protein
MVDLITRWRLLVNDAAAATWSGLQAQDIIDPHQTRVWREPLEMETTYTSGTTTVYKTYHSRFRNLESGTACFQIEDSAGAQRGTADYTADYIRGIVTMVADQVGTALYLTGYAYDLAAAAADAWRMQAGNVAAYYSFEADGHRLSRSDWFKHCQMMAQMLDAQAQPVTVRAWRNGDFDRE